MTASPTDAPALVAAAKTLGVELQPDAADALLRYLDAMLLLNEQINLTAIRDREQAVVLHALDGLAFGRTGLEPRNLLDIGSGNGFPGVAVAALHRRASIVLMDRTGKKVRAMGACLLTAKIQGVETLNLDAQQAPTLKKEMRAAFDVITARAVGTAKALGELAQPLLRIGGHLVLWLDADGEAPEKLERLHRQQVIDYDLPAPAARRRRLAVYRLR